MTEKPVLPPEFTVDLEDGETTLAFARARLPRFATRRATFVGVHLVVYAVDALRNRRALSTTKSRSSELGFPLDRKMALLITDNRIVIWRTSRSSAPRWLGGVPRSKIARAAMPFVGGGWRTVILETTDGVLLRFQIDRDNAERFVESLSSVA